MLNAVAAVVEIALRGKVLARVRGSKPLQTAAPVELSQHMCRSRKPVPSLFSAQLLLLAALKVLSCWSDICAHVLTDIGETVASAPQGN